MMTDLRRFGVMVPSSDSVVEADFKNFLPSSVTFHTARLMHHDETPRGAPTMDEICNGLEAAADSLVQVLPEFIVFACTAASFYKGVGWDDQLRERIIARTRLPAIITSSSIVQAFKALKIHNAFMITPYPEDINRREINYFGHHKIEISDSYYFHLRLSREICLVSPQAIYDQALKEADRIKRCGALFISCTGLRAMEIIEALEKSLGVPVLTSNASIVYAVLKVLNLRAVGRLDSQLFRTLPQSS
jgi:maleate isomerase